MTTQEPAQPPVDDAIAFGRVTPVLRIFDVGKAEEFYGGFLGFAVDWNHRFDANAPLYRQISRGDLVLHLSEHHGDGSPARGCGSPCGAWKPSSGSFSAKATASCAPASRGRRGTRWRPA